MSTADPRDTSDVAWLDARESGASVVPPIDADRAAAYDELQGLICALPDQAAPEGWQADVMAALPPAERAVATASPVDRTDMPAADVPVPETVSDAANGGTSDIPDDRRIGDMRPRRRRWNPGAAAVAAVAVAAAGLVLWVQRPAVEVRDARDDPPSARIVSAAGSRHGDASGEAAIGDVLQIEVTEVSGGELRIYRDDREVVLRCPGQAGCTQTSGRITAQLRLISPGSYRAVYLLPEPARANANPEPSPAPSSPPTGTLEGDLAACHCASRTAVPIVAR